MMIGVLQYRGKTYDPENIQAENIPKIFRQKIFTKNIFRQKIFTKNIFRQKIFTKKIFRQKIFTKKITV
jgi:hypothetical protein